MSRITWIVAAVAGLSLGLSAASAQELTGSPCPCGAGATTGGIATAPHGAGVAAPAGVAIDGSAVGASAPSGRVHAYSYYIEYPAPARTYVPFGPTDTFSYQGQAYGHAYDRWTWPAMSNASPGVGRYYQLLH